MLRAMAIYRRARATIPNFAIEVGFGNMGPHVAPEDRPAVALVLSGQSPEWSGSGLFFSVFGYPRVGFFEPWPFLEHAIGRVLFAFSDVTQPTPRIEA
jgi:hypothetical protein